MRNLKVRDVPVEDRYDLTLLKIGYKDVSTSSPKIVTVFFIDNNEDYLGKTLSRSFDFSVQQDVNDWREFCILIDVNAKKDPNDKWKYLQPFLAVRLKARVSAKVEPVMLNKRGKKWVHVSREFEGNITVKYNITDFQSPSDPPEKIINKRIWSRNDGM